MLQRPLVLQELLFEIPALRDPFLASQSSKVGVVRYGLTAVTDTVPVEEKAVPAAEAVLPPRATGRHRRHPRGRDRIVELLAAILYLGENFCEAAKQGDTAQLRADAQRLQRMADRLAEATSL